MREVRCDLCAAPAAVLHDRCHGAVCSVHAAEHDPLHCPLCGCSWLEADVLEAVWAENHTRVIPVPGLQRRGEAISGRSPAHRSRRGVGPLYGALSARNGGLLPSAIPKEAAWTR